MRVYVFLKPRTGWSTVDETAKLTASDDVLVLAGLGSSVAIGGNAVVCRCALRLSGRDLSVRSPSNRLEKHDADSFKRIGPEVTQEAGWVHP
ncbi:MAG: hypothetical protein DMG76_32990 [Acidobacteria bacterium]|nr:MAG: hypothetical protein DMG76_32990 [Acidobacteriota bacterium]